MKLINQITGKAFLMTRKADPAALFHETLVLEKLETSMEWTIDIKPREAILPLPPEILVGKTSAADRELVAAGTLAILFDGEPVLDRHPLLEKAPRILHNPHKLWFPAIDQDEPQGIFLPNGTVIQAVIRLPKIPKDEVGVTITIPARLYEWEMEG